MTKAVLSLLAVACLTSYASASAANPSSDQTEPALVGKSGSIGTANAGGAGQKMTDRDPACVPTAELLGQLDSLLSAPAQGVALQPVADPAAAVLNQQSAGASQSATANQPVSDDQLSGEWGLWRERFMAAVQWQMQNAIDHPGFAASFAKFMSEDLIGDPPPRFLPGTQSSFVCKVASDGRITEIAVRRSGSFDFDRTLVTAIHRLEGAPVLKFPTRSPASSVLQEGRVITGLDDQIETFDFADLAKIAYPGESQ